jgi:hypothetical protein
MQIFVSFTVLKIGVRKLIRIQGIKLADSRNYIYIIYRCCIIAMVLVAIPLMWIVKGRRDKREVRKDSNGVGNITASSRGRSDFFGKILAVSEQ